MQRPSCQILRNSALDAFQVTVCISLFAECQGVRGKRFLEQINYVVVNKIFLFATKLHQIDPSL